MVLLKENLEGSKFFRNFAENTQSNNGTHEIFSNRNRQDSTTAAHEV